MQAYNKYSNTVSFLFLLISFSCLLNSISAQRDSERDSDDFDDSGFDDSGYNSPQNHDAEGSHHNPSSYSPANEEDLDDDDEVDESNNVAKVATNPPPQQFYSPANSIVMPIPLYQRHKRSIVQKEADIEDLENGSGGDPAKPLIRKRRYSKKYIGPVYTYVKTDKHAHYKWGVKHKVGKHLG
uniref:Uncharacterized protein n=1 Tax=Aceria tosichella TaxID=561515 RepID=A0A6G1SPL7_9ACAR